MAGSVNKVILIGNLGRDPEVRRMNNGEQVVSFGLAMTESWRDKATGERKERTEWANIVIFNDGIGKIAEQYCKKGSKVYIEGQLQTREFTDKEGVQRKTTEVVLQRYRGELTLLSGRNEGSTGDYAGNSANGAIGSSDSNASFGRASPMEPRGERRPAPANAGRSSDMDDDIPF